MNKTIDLSELTDAEVQEEHKKRKKGFITMNVVFIVLVVVSIMNYFAGTSFIFSIFPIFFLPIMMRNGKLFTESKEEITKRNLPL